MPRLPPFQEPSTYIRYVGPVLGHAGEQSGSSGKTETRYLRLNAREAPLKYQYRSAFVNPGVQTALQTFGDFELTPKHIAQFFMGVSLGGRVRFYHPFDERVLKWDQPTLDLVNERDTANIEYEDSPIDDPQFEFWLAPTENFVPGVDVENVLTDVVPRRSIDIHVLFLAAKFTYEFVTRETDPDTYEKLRRFQIPSKHVTFGGKI